MAVCKPDVTATPPDWESARPRSIFSSRSRILTLFLLIDVLIYLDRGIVPGAHDEYEAFLKSAPAVRQHPEFFFGLLQSVFIGGLALAAPVLSWLAAKTRRPLLYLSQGLVVWTFSLTLCAAAGILGSVPLFFVARALSGVGEGAFIALMIPILVDAFSVKDRGLFLGLFYGLMPVGTAIGFISSALMARHFPCWLIFVFLASLASLPIWAVCKFATTPASHGVSPLRHFAAETPIDLQHDNPLAATTGLTSNPPPVVPDLEEVLSERRRRTRSSPSRGDPQTSALRLPSTSASEISALSHSNAEVTLIDDLNASTDRESTPHFAKILRSPNFLSLTVAGAAQAALSSVLVSFGVAFLLNLELFPSELGASMVIGVAGSSLGALGTVIGGLLLWIPQRLAVRRERKWFLRHATLAVPPSADATVASSAGVWLEESEDIRRQRRNILSHVSNFIVLLALPASLLLSASPFLLWQEMTRVAATLFGLGLILIFMCQSGLNLAVMLCAPASHRSLAISAFALGLHIFGDVPGPVLIGYLKDMLAPACSSADIIYPAEIEPELTATCREQRDGVLLTLGLSLMWSHFVWIGVCVCGRLSKVYM